MKEKIHTSVLWDVENVTPTTDSLFIDGLISLIEEEGNLSSATAFGDWSKSSVKKIAGSLAENGFELIHVPRSRKNSADISLITFATQMVFQYPHIERYIILTGDIDFRPLLFTLRKHGKQIWIICDSRNASEDLLTLSDRYYDYRNIIPDEFSQEEGEETGSSVNREEAFKLLAEAVDIMEKDGKIPTFGSVKIKMKLLNASFNEEKLGYRKWKDFIQDAVKHNAISINETDNKLILSASEKDKTSRDHKNTPLIFTHLIEAAKAINDQGGWIDFSVISNKLKDNGIELKDYGYSKLKKLVLDAEKRGLVETKNNHLKWYLKVR